MCAQRNVALATTIKGPTPVADKNLVVSGRSTHRHDRTRVKMVTPTYTEVLLQIAIILESRAKPASLLVFNQKRRVGQSRRQLLISSPLQTREDVLQLCRLPSLVSTMSLSSVKHWDSVLGENKDLHEYDHYLRHWGVGDLFESPLQVSVLEHVRRYDQRREKTAQRYTAGFGLGLRTWKYTSVTVRPLACGLHRQKTLRNIRLHSSVSQQTHHNGGAQKIPVNTTQKCTTNVRPIRVKPNNSRRHADRPLQCPELQATTAEESGGAFHVIVNST